MRSRVIEAEYIFDDKPALDPPEPSIRLDLIFDISLSKHAHPFGVLQSRPSFNRLNPEIGEKLPVLSE